jgi:hypothetical protein
VSIEDRIRNAAQSKVRVSITGRKRCNAGFTIAASDGTRTTLPSKRIALQFLLAIVRCATVRTFELKAATRSKR